MRIEQLTFTRFIAAMAIVFFHFGKPLNVFSHPFIHKLLIQANIGVSYFFILSGFVMIIAYGRKSKVHPVSYFKNRLARIYPVYLLAILGMMLFVKVAENKTYSFIDILLNIFAVQSWIPEKAMTVNFPGWSLSVEFLFYALFPFLFNYIYNKFELKKLLFPTIIFWLISQFFFNWMLKSNFQLGTEKETTNFLFYFPLMHLNQFIIGNIAGLVFIRYLKNSAKNYDWVLIVISLLIILALTFKPDINYHNGLLAVLFVPFIIFTALNTGFISKISNHKFLVYLGEISYGIYILQIPVYLFTKYFLVNLGVTGDFKIFCGGVVVLLIVSALSYHYIETPLREKIKKTRFSFK